jgi:hypothetical protein
MTRRRSRFKGKNGSRYTAVALPRLPADAQIATIVTPDTILAWNRSLAAFRKASSVDT